MLAAVTCCSPAPELEKSDFSASAAPASASIVSGVWFADETDCVGLDFVHDNGGTGRRYMPEIMGSGGSALDYDGDGWVDLYFVQSGRVPGAAGSAGRSGTPPVNRLYRNLGNSRFIDVTERAGAGDSGYGMGAVAADYDNDGDIDLYLINFGTDTLLRNDGDGTFTDVTRAAGIHSPLWGSSAAFLDADADGLLDLYVVNYVDFSVEQHIVCGAPSKGIEAYCHPDVYPMAPDVFFHQRADGTFVPATEEVGLTDITGKGLGVVVADVTGDELVDLYVANDSTPNFLFRNRGGGRFEEVGLVLGVAFNEDGRTEAGMGTDAGDVDGDGRLDLVVTNLAHETNTLYLASAGGFSDHTRSSGLYQGSFLRVGFGADLADFDNDGDLDLLVTNGHIIDNVELFDDAQSFAQPSQLFLNDGAAHFSEITPQHLGDLSHPRVGRGTITLDFDRDGRLDVAISSNNDRARLFRNTHESDRNWLAFRLESGVGNRQALGGRVTVEAGDRAMVQEVKAGSSYQTSGEVWLHFGLAGAMSTEQVTVRWPSGTRQVLNNLPANRFYVLSEAR